MGLLLQRTGMRSVFSLFPLTAILALTLLALGIPAEAQAADEGEGTPELISEPGSEADSADTDADAADVSAEDELLRQGADVYGQMCSSCHQAGGVGLEGSFPPLKDNPHVEDAEYVREVIQNGRSGELTVNGVTYDSVMPPFSTLSDDQVDSVIVYIQSGFAAPQSSQDEFDATGADTGPVAGTELPGFANVGSNMVWWLSFLVGLGVVAPYILSANDRLQTPWLDAWLKTGVIFVAAVVLLVFIPDWAIRTKTVAGLSRTSQDIIGVGLWGTGLVLFLGGLWLSHKESRI